MSAHKRAVRRAIALDIGERVVASALQAAEATMISVTGANRGGKSTFLRSVGIATMLMRCGAFVAAATCTAELATSIHTHFRREAHPRLVSGKLDENCPG